MEQINVFHKGVVSDIDYTKRSPDTWDFPSLNVRVINKKGQGFIITPIDGNTNPDTVNGEEFSMSESYYPIGSNEFNGIVYIVSYSTFLGKGEIGTFPSPANWNSTGNSSFVREYKPLKNFLSTGGSLPTTNFNSTEFNFAITNMVDVLIKPSYDDSVDLYLADFRNPCRVINSGFNNKIGSITGRYHKEEEFDGAINQILTSQTIPVGDLEHIRSGGSLPPGTIWLFVRYLNSNYNKTPFLMEVGPFQIHNDNTEFGIDGLPEYNGINQQWRTDKAIEFSMTNLDESYDSIEIAVVRWTANQNVPAQADVYLIAKRYPIDDIITNGGAVTIFGSEDQSTLTFDEIVLQSINETIPRTHTQLDDRYFGANWRKIDYDRDALVSYASLISIGYNVDVSINDATYESIIDNYGGYSQHKQVDSPNVTFDYTGHFRGEIYPYGVVFLLADGTETEAFPLEGKDDIGITALASAITNEKGLYRFPMRGANQTKSDKAEINNFNRVMGVVLDNTTAISFKNSNSTRFNNIVGFYYVRGERIKNFLYQGTAFNVYNRTNVHGVVNYFGGTSNSDYVAMPYYNNAFPNANYNSSSSQYNYGSIVASVKDNRLGLFSPEHILSVDEKIIDGETVYVSPIVEFTGAARKLYTASLLPQSPGPYSLDLWADVAISQNSDQFTEVRAYNVHKSVFNGPEGFSSILRDGLTQSNYGWNQYDGENSTGYNRSIVTSKYLGLIKDSGVIFNEYTLCNVYRFENNASFFDNTINAFSVKNTAYSKISQIIDLDTNTSGSVFYKGDCFQQRTFLRTWRWFGFDDNPDEYHDGSGIIYQHGCLVGMITEAAVNTAMRNQVEGQVSNNLYMYSYFPKTETINREKTSWISASFATEDLVEAIQINDGYNQTISGSLKTGYDKTIPAIAEQRPNRIRFSAEHESHSFFDGYRDLRINSYQDFNIDKGEIMGIEELNGLLCSIQKDIVNQHYIGQKQLSADDGTVAFIDSSIYLQKETRTLGNFGSQHQWSVKKTPNGIYFVDEKRKMIIACSLKSSQSGSSYLGAEPISDTKSINKRLYEILDTERTDIVEEYSDTPMSGDGIIIGYDAKYKDVMITFLQQKIEIDYEEFTYQLIVSKNTLVYNENIQAFTGEYSFTPGIYLNINNDLFSSLEAFVPLSGLVYLHNRQDSILTFYGTLEDMILSWIVNGMVGQQNATTVEKMFFNQDIESGEEEFDKIIYLTEFQEGEQDPFYDATKFWETPEYLENHWNLTINVKSDASRGEFDDGSGMRGTYLKVTLYYKKAVATHIRKVATNFKISKA